MHEASQPLENHNIPPQYLVVMGVSGTGKTTVGEGLARCLGWPFQEGDALHPPANVEKMRSGIPLNDEDRAPWLKFCHEWLEKQMTAGRGGILTCSALKRKYRDLLRAKVPVTFIYLRTDPDLLFERLKHRTGHYMPPTLLPSQLATLEEPTEDEPVMVIPGNMIPSEQLKEIVRRLDKAAPDTVDV